MKSVIFISVLSILFLAGCASTKGYEQTLQTWIGSSEASLVRKWGIPAHVYKSGGRKYLAYNSSRNVYIPGTSPTYRTTYSPVTATTTGYGSSTYNTTYAGNYATTSGYDNSTYQTTYSGGTATTKAYGGSAPMNLNFQCTTTFEISNGSVSSWSYKGNDCKAPELDQDEYNYQSKMRNIARQIPNDKKYNRLALNTTESKKWFKDLTFRLWSGKINRNEFISEGLKRYPGHEYEFKFVADRLL